MLVFRVDTCPYFLSDALPAPTCTHGSTPICTHGPAHTFTHGPTPTIERAPIERWC